MTWEQLVLPSLIAGVFSLLVLYLSSRVASARAERELLLEQKRAAYVRAARWLVRAITANSHDEEEAWDIYIELSLYDYSVAVAFSQALHATDTSDPRLSLFQTAATTSLGTRPTQQQIHAGALAMGNADLARRTSSPGPEVKGPARPQISGDE